MEGKCQEGDHLVALRIVICDVNPAEVERYTEVCRAICQKQHVPAVFTGFTSSQALLFEMMDPAFSSLVSILVLEPYNGGEAVAEAVRNSGYDGVIVYNSWITHENYFYQAFDMGAYNYVKKGGMARFEAVFEGALKAAMELERQYIALSCAGEYRQIDLRDIYYFKADMNHMVCMWYKDGKFLFRSNLSDLEARLGERGFLRVHRSFMVSLAAVHCVSNEQATLVNGVCVPVSRKNYVALKTAMDRWSH